MISQHRKCKPFTVIVLTLVLCISHTVISLSPPAPVDYLIPPPVSLASLSVEKTRLNPKARPNNLVEAESRIIPQYVSSQTLKKPLDVHQQQQQHPGFMTRVARWFGFANQNSASDQQLAAATTNNRAYYYPLPQQQHQQGKGDKEPCNLCNKYPWVPMMMPNGIHFPVAAGNHWDTTTQNQHHGIPTGQQHLQNPYGPLQQGQQPLQNAFVTPLDPKQPQQQYAASNIKQRAVQFNFPHPNVYQVANKPKDALNQIQYSSGPFLPIPKVIQQPMPPLYNAQPFHTSITPLPATIQQLPSTEPAHFAENVGEHSEIHIDTIIPTQIPPTTQLQDASFEIIKSHQLLDYVSSIEYPASYVQTHTYDVSTERPLMPLNHKQESKISTGLYQHSTLSPHLNQHIPASQILTEPGSFRAGEQQQSTLQSDNNFEQTTITFNQPQYLDDLQHQQQFEYDNYVAASQQNSSVFDQQQQPHSDAWTLESNDYVYATSTPDTLYTTKPETSTFATEFETTTEPQQQDNEVEFIASVQTVNQRDKIETTKLWPQKPKQRETPKRLLDSPIQHVNGNLGSPRPFTRDPSDLGFRLGIKNHKLFETNFATSTHEPWKPQTVSPASPTPTSTYSALDASGQYAGMSPPAMPASINNQQQILIPYITTKHRPRPFETTRDNSVTRSPFTSAYATWSHDQSAELHTPQESMLVKAHIKPATTTTAKPRTTKYLTKILASNLRELLQREHKPTKLKLSPNSLDIDLNKLQKNIDDWTEQEYTSLSHRPSTPTIRGRSKHIPSEYLPSTTTTTTVVKSTRQSKTSKGFEETAELPSSINNLEPLYERESTKQFRYAHLNDNQLQDFYDNFEALKSRTSVKPKTTTSTTTTTTTTAKPLYLRPVIEQEPEELWKKAKVSISPQTQEKVYVVTPQPRFFPQRFYSPTVPTTTEKSLHFLGSGFKSPRFLVRPTPGSDTDSKENLKDNLSKSYFSPEWFGLRGLSTYVPAEPVEINDGNSKVLTIVTPPSNLETTTPHNIMDLTKYRHSANTRKSTMAPSPR